MLKRRLTLIVKVDNSLRMIGPAQAARDGIAAQFRYFSARWGSNQPGFFYADADFFEKSPT